MPKVKFACGGPVQTKFVLVMAGGNVRMAAGLNIGIDANGYAGRSGAAFHLFRGFFEQDAEFGFGFDVEKQQTAKAGVGAAAVAKSFPNFLARFADARKYDLISRNRQMAKMFKLAARDNIETAAELRKGFENTEISAGFYS